jgi:glycosyltransferase involved in cell wall biosynthesis
MQFIEGKYLPVQEVKQRVSILVPAYQAAGFIEECLTSIEEQTYFEDNDNFELLVGVDACGPTLKKLSDIRYKYRNLTIIMLEKNVGTYITLNTLMDFIRSKNIIVFGSDDVMRPELVNEVLEASLGADVVKMGYSAFINEKKDARRVLEFAHGAIFFKSKIIDITGGYQPWKCAADTELLQRIAKRVETRIVNKVLFYRRMHSNSMTKRADTGRRSDLRKGYASLIREYEIYEDIKIDRITGKFNKV